MKCPYCGFDNSFYGTESTIVCANCGTNYDASDLRQLSKEEIDDINNSIDRINMCDITLLFPRIKKYIDSEEMSFYVKLESCYGQYEFNLLKNLLPDNYELEIVKRLRQSDDVFIEIIRDRRKPKYEKEMYHIYQKNMYNTDSETEYLLQKSGKDIFLNILYPELIRNKDITIEELSNKYPRYASFSINSQRTRLSKAKRIFELNKQKEAMHIILLSKKLFKTDRFIARQYYKDL